MNKSLRENTEKLVVTVYNGVKKLEMKTEKNLFQKFNNFLKAFGATRMLLQRAHKEGFLIEGIVLYASLIDGFLRIALVLKKQLDTKTSEIDESFIYQNKMGNYYTERQIYKHAYKNKVIDNYLYKEINKLYNKRNKAVHRFFLSDIEYCHLPEILIRYEIIYQKLYKIVYDLEKEQINTGIGITIKGSKITGDEIKEIIQNIGEKIDSKKDWGQK